MERAPGEGTGGAAGEKVAATLGGAGLMWHHPGRPQGREAGARGEAAKKRRNLVRKGGHGGLLSPDKDGPSERKGNG